MNYSKLIKSAAKLFDGCLERGQLLHGRMAYGEFDSYQLSPLLPLAHIQHSQGGCMLSAIYKKPYTSMGKSEIARLEQVLYDEGICSDLILENAARAYCEQKFQLKNDSYGLSFNGGELSGFWIESHLYLYTWNDPSTESSTENQLRILINDLCEALLTREKLIIHQRVA